MGITVRHDFNPGMLPYEIGYADFLEQLRRRQQQQSGPESPAARQASADATNARMRGDRAKLGERQAARARGELPPDPSTEAGFNWQTPVQVFNPEGGYRTHYQNQGADPMRTGAFGGLGTKEQNVYDTAGVIDLDNPYDRQMLDRVTRLPGNNFVEADRFRSKEEIEQRHYQEQSRDHQQAYEKRQAVLQKNREALLAEKAGEAPFGVTKEGEKLDRDYARDMDAWRKGQDELKSVSPGAQEILDQDASRRGMGADAEDRLAAGPTTGEENEYTPWQERKRQVHLAAIAKAMSDDSVRPELRAKAIRQAQDDLLKITPLTPKKSTHNFKYTTSPEDGSVMEIDENTGKRSKPAELQPAHAKAATAALVSKIYGEVEDALVREHSADPTYEPTEAEILPRVQARMNVIKQFTEPKKPDGPFAPGKNATHPAEYDRQKDDEVYENMRRNLDEYPPVLREFIQENIRPELTRKIALHFEKLKAAGIPSDEAMNIIAHKVAEAYKTPPSPAQQAPAVPQAARALSMIRTEELHPEQARNIASHFAELKAQGVPLDQAMSMVAMEMGVGAR